MRELILAFAKLSNVYKTYRNDNGLDNAENVGWKAYIEGESLDDNPFAIKTSAWHAWREGYFIASSIGRQK